MGLILWKQSAAQHIVTVYRTAIFYNRELAALVVVELKRGDFKPAYLGQLSAYLRILDSEVKKPFENPSIGIILCYCCPVKFCGPEDG